MKRFDPFPAVCSFYHLKQVENILMDDDGTYVLCDFGSATAKFWNPKIHSVKEIEEELSRF